MDKIIEDKLDEIQTDVLMLWMLDLPLERNKEENPMFSLMGVDIKDPNGENGKLFWEFEGPNVYNPPDVIRTKDKGNGRMLTRIGSDIRVCSYKLPDQRKIYSEVILPGTKVAKFHYTPDGKVQPLERFASKSELLRLINGILI